MLLLSINKTGSCICCWRIRESSIRWIIHTEACERWWTLMKLQTDPCGSTGVVLTENRIGSQTQQLLSDSVSASTRWIRRAWSSSVTVTRTSTASSCRISVPRAAWASAGSVWRRHRSCNRNPFSNGHKEACAFLVSSTEDGALR